MTSSFEISTPSSLEWDEFVKSHPRGHVLQLSAWAGLKRPYGWDSLRVALQKRDKIVAGAQILFKPLPARLGHMAYLPMGPLLTLGEQRDEMWKAIHSAAKKHGAAFIKWEPGLYERGEAPHDFARAGFTASEQTVQPPRTVVIDISGTEDEIMARMNQGTRRKIRQSDKNGVKIHEATRDEVKKFTDMMQVTGSRNAFGVHEASYYTLAYDLLVPDHAALLIAEHEGDTLAGIMVFAVGKWAWYLYGASSSVKRNLMGAYGVQWAAIQWAKARGCTHYDMWGVPDADLSELEAQFEKREDGLWGVYGFKRGWGGEVVRSAGAWDKGYNFLLYNAYRLAVKARQGSE